MTFDENESTEGYDNRFTYVGHPMLQPDAPGYVELPEPQDYKLAQPVFDDAELLVYRILVNHFALVEQAGGPFVQVTSSYEQAMQTPVVLAINTRRTGLDAYGNRDEMWLRSAIMEINVVTDGVDAETDAIQIHESVKQALVIAWRNQTYYPNLGILNTLSSPLTATRQTDWATSTGPVQYSKLPEGTVRYEARYKMIIRPPYEHDNKYPPFGRGY